MPDRAALRQRLNARLLDIAEGVAAPYAADENVRAILLTGSVARGEADLDSDVDLILYLAEPATPERFEAECEAARASGGGVYGGGPEVGFGVYRVVEGVKVDLGFNLTSTPESMLHDLLIDHDTADTSKQLIVRGILGGRALHGGAQIAAWRTRAERYPDELAHKAVRENLRFHSPWVMAGMGAARGDAPFVMEQLLDDQRRVLAVLCGLNRCYHPGKLKGLASLLPELPLRPSRLLERFEGAYRAPLVEAVREHRALIDELLTLVERAMPEIDTGPQRAFRARSHGVGEPTLGPFLALAEPPR